MNDIKKQIFKSDGDPYYKLFAYWLLKKGDFLSDNSKFQVTPFCALQPKHQRITGREIQERQNHINTTCIFSPPPPPPSPPPPPPSSLQSFSSEESSCPE